MQFALVVKVVSLCICLRCFFYDLKSYILFYIETRCSMFNMDQIKSPTMPFAVQVLR